jgi:hypothetical protein
MVDTWLQVFQTKAPEWNIPPAKVTSLPTADTNAKSILAVVKSGERAMMPAPHLCGTGREGAGLWKKVLLISYWK